MRIQNRSPFKAEGARYRVENRTSSDEATIYLYDEIGFFGVNAKQFVKDLNGVTAGTIHLRVNSPGGSVFDGTTIYNAIKQHKSRIVAHVDGLAASIASVIVMGADEIQMADNAYLMIHEPWSVRIGGAEDMRDEADLLEKIRGTICKTYMDKSGKDESEVLAMMAAETWMTAQESLDAGFADTIYGQKLEKAEVTLFDLSVFSRVPERLQAGANLPTAREIERILKENGCSTKQAKAILAAGYDSLQRDVAGHDDQPEATVNDQRDVDLPTSQPQASQRDVDGAEKPESVKPKEIDNGPSPKVDESQALILKALQMINQPSQEG